MATVYSKRGIQVKSSRRTDRKPGVFGEGLVTETSAECYDRICREDKAEMDRLMREYQPCEDDDDFKVDEEAALEAEYQDRFLWSLEKRERCPECGVSAEPAQMDVSGICIFCVRAGSDFEPLSKVELWAI